MNYVNPRYGRSGTLWEGRHKGCVTSSDEYLLACMRYIELNPVRAGVVATPGEYRWSSYLQNVTGVPGGLVLPHPVYTSLGTDDTERGFVYRKLLRQTLEPDQVYEIRASVQTGTPLGNDRFREPIEKALYCKLGQARRGKPSKQNQG